MIAIDPDPENVRVARENLLAEGLLGSRVTVLQRELENTGLPKLLCRSDCSRRSLRQEMSERMREEADRLQRPFGGKLCWTDGGELVGPNEAHYRGAVIGHTNMPTRPIRSTAAMRWSRGELSVLWYRDLDFAIPSRHGRAPAPLSKDGRLFHEGMNGLVAVDAYNGRELWRYDIPNVLKAYDGDELMGVAGTGSNFCVGGDSVYVRHGQRCLRLDAANGSLIGEFRIPHESRCSDAGLGSDPSGDISPGSMACSLALLPMPEHVVTYRYVNRGGDMTRQLTESTSLFAIDTAPANSCGATRPAIPFATIRLRLPMAKCF